MLHHRSITTKDKPWPGATRVAFADGISTGKVRAENLALQIDSTILELGIPLNCKRSTACSAAVFRRLQT